MLRTTAITLALATGLLVSSSASLGSQGQRRRSLQLSDLLSTAQVMSVALSPDGQRVLYEVRRTLLDENQYVSELWLQEVEGAGHARRIVTSARTTIAFRTLKANWSPDGQVIAYLSDTDGKYQLREYSLTDGQDTPVALPANLAEFDWRSTPTNAIQFSPDSSRLAIAISATRSSDQANDASARQHARLVGVRWPYDTLTPNAVLWVYDRHSGQVTKITNGDTNVSDISWSPDGTRIVFASSPETGTKRYHTDLYVVDLATKAVRPLVIQPGWDRQPIWSPDGKWIAFVSQRGRVDWNYGAWAAVVPAAGNGEPKYLAENIERQSGSAPLDLWWGADSAAVYFCTGLEFERRLFRAPLASNLGAEVTPPGKYFSYFSPSRDGTRWAFGVETVTEPADVFVADGSWKTMRQLTHLNPTFAEILQPHVETISWRSRDNRFDIHGVLVAPPDFDPKKKYPTIVYAAGGPSMVRMGFNLDEGVLPHLLFAAKGYLVFIPNTRGRRGFGTDFREAMPQNTDFLPGPYDDLMAGLSMLIDRGISDPDRLAIMGFSYGGGLAAYALTKTTQFKSAIIYEGFPNNLRVALVSAGNPDGVQLMHDQRGFRSIWEPGSIQQLLDQSPLFSFDKVKTPTLLIYGENGAARTDGIDAFRALRQAGVRSELAVYPRTGHGADEPQLIEDTYCRAVNWIEVAIGTEHPATANSDACVAMGTHESK